MNRGDTTVLILNYELNGSALVEDAYQEIELQINAESMARSIKKLFSKGEIVWGTVSYVEDGIEKEFTGYHTLLNQEETFKLASGKSNVQLRIMLGGEVGSSPITDFDVGNVLSAEVLNASAI